MTADDGFEAAVTKVLEVNNNSGKKASVIMVGYQIRVPLWSCGF